MEVDTNVSEVLQEAGNAQEIVLEIDKSTGDCGGEFEEVVEEIEEIVEIIEEIEEVEEPEIQNEVLEEVVQVVEQDSHQQIFETSNNARVHEESVSYTDKVRLKKYNSQVKILIFQLKILACQICTW